MCRTIEVTGVLMVVIQNGVVRRQSSVLILSQKQQKLPEVPCSRTVHWCSSCGTACMMITSRSWLPQGYAQGDSELGQAADCLREDLWLRSCRGAAVKDRPEQSIRQWLKLHTAVGSPSAPRRAVQASLHRGDAANLPAS